MNGPLASARFGRRIAAERKRRGWSTTALAGKAGTGRTVIMKLERGTQGCTLDSAVLLADALGISLDGLSGPCGQCHDRPPSGFTCDACGTAGPQAQDQRRGGTP